MSISATISEASSFRLRWGMPAQAAAAAAQITKLGATETTRTARRGIVSPWRRRYDMARMMDGADLCK
ncbi:hypothetical protein THAOC_31755 [Thalassiosira oceanica]|uniref:Uncharacterized protein n=1 Tax=Thalassiosira oceanica TaxID=159749 RepID=K0RRS1_THAOC|nr:hypothetical protein THAOC_31755 [Thalassiosira oceanica]|eukprot:EJK49377.1 hypothetical protein THAOC_31755 [Thalassiosira oceanica]